MRSVSLDLYNSMYLVHLAGFELTNSREDKVYYFILGFAYKETVYDCNRMLERLHMKPLTNYRKGISVADRSFKEYTGSRFYDQFFNAIKSYVLQNRHNIELSSRTVSSADYAELSDFEIKSVGIDDRDGMGIAI